MLPSGSNVLSQASYGNNDYADVNPVNGTSAASTATATFGRANIHRDSNSSGRARRRMVRFHAPKGARKSAVRQKRTPATTAPTAPTPAQCHRAVTATAATAISPHVGDLHREALIFSPIVGPR